MRRKQLVLIFLLLSVVFGCNDDQMAELEDINIPKGVIVENVYSKDVGQNYTIYIYLPPNYSSGKDSLPVLYMLDADYEFAKTVKYAAEKIQKKKIAPLIIVGIGYAGNSIDMRERDYTPIAKTSVPDFANCCGAENFFGFIEKELILKIDSTYRTQTNKNRGIAGHSLGGLFSYYCFFNHPDVFTKYLAASPSVWWDNNVCFDYENKLALATPSFLYPTKLMVTLGLGGEGAGGVISLYVEELFDRIDARNYGNFNAQYTIVDNPFHSENWQDAYDEALDYLFPNE